MHSETELFEYLNNSLSEEHSSAIEKHLAACEECASVAALVRALKTEGSQANSQIMTERIQNHPAINELASFFYSQEQSAEIPHVASHVARCSFCAEAIAQYASGQRAAEMYEPSNATPGEVPEDAWKMIDDWENSSFGNLKPANEVLGQELLDRLAGVLSERAIREAEIASRTSTTDRIPVLVVSSSGEVRGVEFFDHETDKTGARILRHSEGSERFDKRPIHVMFSFDEKQPLVVTTVMNRDTVRLEQSRSAGEAQRADYFIIED
jgi:hypothetical protein